MNCTLDTPRIRQSKDHRSNIPKCEVYLNSVFQIMNNNISIIKRHFFVAAFDPPINGLLYAAQCGHTTRIENQ